MMHMARLLLALVAVALASPAGAHHRQTPPVVALTTSGDTALPRVPAAGNKTMTLALQAGGGRKIVAISPWKDRKEPALQTLIASTGDHDNPAVSFGGRTFAFDTASDPQGSGLPGRQVVAGSGTSLAAVSSEPFTRAAIPPSLGWPRESAQAFGLKVLPSEAGMLSRIQRGLREISASTTIVAR